MEKKEVGYLFQLSAVLADGVNLTVSGNFSVNAPLDEMNSEVDRIREVFLRQRAKNEVGVIESQLMEDKRRLSAMVFDLGQHEARNSKRTVDKEAAERLRRAISDAEAHIERGEQALVETKARAQ